MTLPGQLNPPFRLMLSPGPSNVDPRVLRAMTNPLVGHLDPYFLQIMDEVREMLRQVFQTSNHLTIPMSATGMAGMETCFSNLVEPGDRVVLCVKGFFGQRMVEVAARTQAELTVLEQTWGEVFDLNQIRETLQRVRPKVLGMVQAETSTGVWQPVEELGKLCHEFDTLLVLDTVPSLGCIPVALDAWEVDAAFSCSQKGLSCPPGLAPVSLSPRAVEAISRRKAKTQNWYFDLSMVQKYWANDRVYHHTAPISMIYALHEGLRIVLEEGLETRWERHRQNHLALKAGLTALGLTYVAAEEHQLPQLSAVRIPPGVNDLAFRKQMLLEFGIEIGSGLDKFKGQVWRIGLMGYNSQQRNVLLVLAALERCLIAQGVRSLRTVV